VKAEALTLTNLRTGIMFWFSFRTETKIRWVIGRKNSYKNGAVKQEEIYFNLNRKEIVMYYIWPHK